MSKKRYGDIRLEGMNQEQLLAYAKRITRDHGRAQESINRLRNRVEQLEGALGDDAPLPAPVHQEPHRTSAPHRTAPHRARCRHMVLRKAGEAGHE